jgi:hypothetical protein
MNGLMRSGNLTMKYSIFNRLRSPKGDEMSIKPKRVDGFVQREKPPSIEHRTEIQLQLQELRNLLLEGDNVEARQGTDVTGGRKVIAFQTEFDENVLQADMR